jgi:hypothetical protein
MYMTWRAARWIGFAIAMGLVAAGCVRVSPQEQMKAALEAQCKAGTGPCPNQMSPEMTVKCQAGDPAACQKLAVDKCESGDRLSCQSLAVTYVQLKPLCNTGKAAACRGMNLPWPSAKTWNPEQSLAQARSDCQAGKEASCRALGTNAQVYGDRIIWTQSYVAPAKKN